ncbi:MAG: RAMP superfamily CRISPR-associated protein [Promethearchaeota archaeon]
MFIGHSEISKRIILTVELETLEPVHVGSEKETSLSSIDLPIIRDSNGNPTIPGSTIKGVLRSYYSRLINSAGDDILNRYNIKKIKDGVGSLNEIEKRFTKAEKIDDKQSIIENELGTIEKLFGISGLASAIVITDATSSNCKVRVNKHIKIDNNTDKIVKGGLFDVEAVDDKNIFEFKIIYDFLKDKAYSDVNNFVENILKPSLNKGLELFIGGQKSRGYGLVKASLKKEESYTIEDLLLNQISRS